jgi:deoxyribodipyrimidine photo-lyase
MSRDQRASDNWALIFGQEEAMKKKEALLVVFCLVPEFWMPCQGSTCSCSKGFETSKYIEEKQYPFFLLKGSPQREIPKIYRSPYRRNACHRFRPAENKAPVEKSGPRRNPHSRYEVDAHNIVPCWCASSKQEFAARTFRPKITKQLPEFLDAYPHLFRHPFTWTGKHPLTNGAKSRAISARPQRIILRLDHCGREDAAEAALKHFINRRLAVYDETRERSTKDGQSGLSPFLHFGTFRPKEQHLK